ncbi:hypothetical protein ACISU4_01210 [Streptomyces wuyuanensis]|uniref:hypothetical protein n=1 Tax=Streptomyces wuyuanensis TaxID=1196353 RepID=UPI00381859E7
MIESLLANHEKLLKLTPDMLGSVAAGAVDADAPRKKLLEHLQDDAAAGSLFARVCTFEAPYGESWVHQPGSVRPYLSLELAEEVFPPGRLRSVLADIVLSESTAIPFDYRALAAEILSELGPGPYAAVLRKVVDCTEPLKSRTLAGKADTRTDGIDHLFDIPETQEGRLRLLEAASLAKTRESRALLARRILQADGAPSGDGAAPGDGALRGALTSAEAERLIEEDSGTDFISPSDYLVIWDQELATPSAGATPLTLAELLRITLLCPEFSLPDATVRPVLVSFYRSVLRVSGRAIIGLKGGVFYVEHGADAHPSYFYMGRDAVIGKGCTIDCVGGAVLQQGSFLGGGFMPILVHTHKHIRNAGEPGVAERKRVLPALFAAKAGARLPMQAIGIFETADYTGQAESPYPGIVAIAFDS